MKAFVSRAWGSDWIGCCELVVDRCLRLQKLLQDEALLATWPTSTAKSMSSCTRNASVLRAAKCLSERDQCMIIAGYLPITAFAAVLIAYFAVVIQHQQATIFHALTCRLFKPRQ